MKIVHRPGASHQNRDALSRRPCERDAETTLPQIVYRLASGFCVPPLQGSDLDTLNSMVTVAALYGVRFIEVFSGRAEAGPILPGTGGQRN